MKRLSGKEKRRIRLHVSKLESKEEKEQFIIYELYSKGYAYCNLASIFECSTREWIQYFEEKNIKLCSGLNKLVSREQFTKRSTSSDGLDIYCREYRRSLVNNSYKKDPDKHCIRMYVHRSQTKIKEKNKLRDQIYNNQYAKFELYSDRLKKYNDIRKDPNDNILIQVKCKNCNDWFNPTNLECRSRIGAINGRYGVGVQSNFYCSVKCKNTCSIYKSKGNTNVRRRDPAVQSQWREMIIEKSIKENGQIQCGVCETVNGPFTAHHFEGINYNPLESADIDAGILLCNICNKRAHSQPGCSPADMRCVSK